MTGDHRSTLQRWLLTDQCSQGNSIEDMISAAFLWCRDHKIFAYSKKIMERLARSARKQFFEQFLNNIADHLSLNTEAKLEASLAAPGEATGFYRLKDDAGAATLENMLNAA